MNENTTFSGVIASTTSTNGNLTHEPFGLKGIWLFIFMFAYPTAVIAASIACKLRLSTCCDEDGIPEFINSWNIRNSSNNNRFFSQHNRSESELLPIPSAHDTLMERSAVPRF